MQQDVLKCNQYHYPNPSYWVAFNWMYKQWAVCEDMLYNMLLNKRREWLARFNWQNDWLLSFARCDITAEADCSWVTLLLTKNPAARAWHNINLHAHTYSIERNTLGQSCFLSSVAVWISICPLSGTWKYLLDSSISCRWQPRLPCSLQVISISKPPPTL